MSPHIEFGRLQAETELARIVAALGGRASGASGICHCPVHDDRIPSLSIRVGDKRLLFKCFAGCDTRDILRAISGLNLSCGWVPPRVQPDARRCRSTFDGRGAALALWRQARPIDGSLAARYLAAREISGSWDALRFHPRVPLGRGTGAIWRPALLSGVSDDDGFCAVQRSFLDPSGLSLATDIDPARRMLGVPRKGAVRLARPRHCLGLAEGIESALSAMLRFKIAVWATTGAERLDHISIPDCISTLVLFPDNDLAGRRSEARAFAAYARDGRRILTRPPPTGFSDWNDVAQQEGRERGGVRLAD